MDWLVKFVKKNYKIVVIGVILLAAGIRMISFGEIPASYQWDELSSAYESFNLVEEGTDRWGNKYPVYFLGWGSGQNVLLAYSAIPFIKIFGLSPVAIRLPLLITGVLTIIFTYLLAKKLFGHKVGFATLLLISILPWNFMMSRWALESNMLPLFVVLGIYLLVLSKEKKYLIPFALIPFAIGLYAYAIFVFVLPFIILGYIYFERKFLLENWKSWLLSVIVALIIAAPFLLFFIKNYITKSDFSFESSLPFSIVKLPISRTDQLMQGEYPYHIVLMISFMTIITGFLDGLEWNSIYELPPLTFAFIPLFIYAIVVLIKQKESYSKQLQTLVPWIIAIVPLFLLFQINLNRANFILPAFTILMAFAIVKFFESYDFSVQRKIVFKFLCFYLIFYSIVFYSFYFLNYSTYTEDKFQKGFAEVFQKTKAIAGEKKIYITQSIPINYLFPLAYDEVTASELKKDGKYFLNNGDMNVLYYKNYFFNYDVRPTIMSEGDEYVLLTRSSDYIDDKCEDGSIKTPLDDGRWKIIVCDARF